MLKLKKAVRIRNFTGSHLQPSLMFEGKSSGLPLKYSLVRMKTNLGKGIKHFSDIHLHPSPKFVGKSSVLLLE
jgi:hypothetical protein